MTVTERARRGRRSAAELRRMQRQIAKVRATTTATSTDTWGNR